MPSPALLGLLSLVACGDKIPTPWSKTEGREEVTTATAAGQSGGSSARATSSGGTATTTDGGDLSCEGDLPTPEGDAVGSISCGGSVEGSSRKGGMRWGDDFYQHAFCTTSRNHYDDAPDVLYRLELPADTKAEITLDSPCADLDLVSVAWKLDGVPDVQHVNRIAECEMDTHGGGGKLTLTTVTKAQTFLVGVDGKNGDEGNFRISVSCGTYR